MLLRIGELAETLGLTKGGVRFLEEKGLLTSVRDEANGYRYYDDLCLPRLHLIRNYTASGFTLEEATALLLSERPEDLTEAMDAKERELTRRIKELREQRVRLARQRRTPRRALTRWGR